MFSALMTLEAPAAPPQARDIVVAEAAQLRPAVRAVIACVLRESLDHADVEDCAHEALRRAMEGHTSARGPLRPWLLGIARHVALDHLRARKRQRDRTATASPDATESEADLVERLVDPDALPDEKLELAERAAKVKRALDALPEGPRAALTMFHLEGIGYGEIATRLSVPLGTVATWVTRGRKALAETLEEEMDTNARKREEREGVS